MVLLREFLSLLRAENVRFDLPMSQVPLLSVFFGTDVSNHPNFCLGWLRFPLPPTPLPPCSAAYGTCVSRVSSEISNVLTLDLCCCLQKVRQLKSILFISKVKVKDKGWFPYSL